MEHSDSDEWLGFGNTFDDVEIPSEVSMLEAPQQSSAGMRYCFLIFSKLPTSL